MEYRGRSDVRRTEGAEVRGLMEEAGRKSLESAGHMFPLTVGGFTWLPRVPAVFLVSEGKCVQNSKDVYKF